MTLLTEYQANKIKMEGKFYNEYLKLTSNPSNSKTEINKYLMKKYNLHSPTSVYTIVKRVRERLDKQCEA